MMKTGILWDLDGTLLDTLADLTDALNYAMDRFGYPRRTMEDVRNFIGNGARRLIALSVPDGADVDAVLAVYKTYYDAHCQIKTRPYEGIPEALAALAQKYPTHKRIEQCPHSREYPSRRRQRRLIHACIFQDRISYQY